MMGIPNWGYLPGQDEKEDASDYWLLIAGTTDSKDIKYTDRSRKNGNYLQGITKDLANMEDHANTVGFVQNVVRDMKYATKSTVIDRIKKCANECKQKNGESITIYYTGHGETGTGNWCMADGAVSLPDVYNAVMSEYPSVESITLHCDCCFSGNWCEQLKQMQVKVDVYINAASYPGTVAWDTKDGGMYTLYETGKKKMNDLPKLKMCDAWKYAEDQVYEMTKH